MRTVLVLALICSAAALEQEALNIQTSSEVETPKIRTRRSAGAGLALSARLLSMLGALRPIGKEILFSIPELGGTGVQVAGVAVDMANTKNQEALEADKIKRLESERLQRARDDEDMRKRLEIIETLLIQLLAQKLSQTNSTIVP